MTDSLVPSSQSPTLSREASLAHALTIVKPYSVVRAAILSKTIYTFWKVGVKDSGRDLASVLTDPTVPRQMAYLVAFDNKDTFQMGYARNGEAAQCVMDIPVERLGAAMQDLRDAGF